MNKKTHETTLIFSILVLCFIAIGSITSCQSERYTKEIKQIDKFITEAKARFDEIPGFSVAIVKDEMPLLIKGYGYSDSQSKTPVTPNTPFYIASTTKSFVGVLAVILEEADKIDLEAPLTNYKPFSELENREIFETTTIKELLNHTSGLQNNFIPFRSSYLGNLTTQDAIRLAEKATRKGDKKYQYSNLGYNLFSLLLEEEFGYNWKDLLQQKIFEPNNMTNTSAYIDQTGSSESEISKGYIAAQPEGTIEGYMKSNGMMHAAGGLVSTSNDLANWLMFNIADGSIGNKIVYESGIVSKSHLNTVQYEPEEGQIFLDQGYAIGWHNASFKDKEVVYHFGGYTGFQTHTSFLPIEAIGIAILSNEQHFGDNLNSIIASYTYEVLIGIEPDQTTYDQKFLELEKLIASLTKSFAKEEKTSDSVRWDLSKNMTAYEGTYRNEFMGTITIEVDENEARFTFGERTATAMPTEGQDIMKVELIPGRPMTFTFNIDENNQINQFTGGGLPFSRVTNQVY